MLREVDIVASGRDYVIDKLKSPPLHAWLDALWCRGDTVQTLARKVATFDAGTRCVRVSETACRELDRYDNVALVSWVDEQQDGNHFGVAKVLHWHLWKCVPKVDLGGRQIQ